MLGSRVLPGAGKARREAEWKSGTLGRGEEHLEGQAWSSSCAYFPCTAGRGPGEGKVVMVAGHCRRGGRISRCTSPLVEIDDVIIKIVIRELTEIDRSFSCVSWYLCVM